MTCPHCLIAFHDVDAWTWARILTPKEIETEWMCRTTVCPSCDSPIIKLVRHPGIGLPSVEHLIYPDAQRRAPVDNAVPEPLREDYNRGLSSLALERKGVGGVVPPCFASHID